MTETSGAGGLSHIDERGAARMVDVSAKDDTVRVAVAEGSVRMRPETLALIQSGGLPKGDVIAVARVAGIMAAKRTSELIPMCHPLPVTGVTVDFEPLSASELGRAGDREDDRQDGRRNGGADRGLGGRAHDL